MKQNTFDILSLNGSKVIPTYNMADPDFFKIDGLILENNSVIGYELGKNLSLAENRTFVESIIAKMGRQPTLDAIHKYNFSNQHTKNLTTSIILEQAFKITDQIDVEPTVKNTVAKKSKMR